MRATLKNLLNVVSILSAFLLVTLLILMAAGYRPYILTSASMEPTIADGSLVFAKHTPIDEVVEGEIVIYRTNGLLVLHRYIGDGQLQGDANQIAQSIELTDANLVGTYCFHIPGVGNAISTLMRHKWLLVVLIGACVILACVRPGKEAKSTT